MSEESPWIERPIENGVGEIEFSSWHDLVTYLHRSMLSYDTYIWRGQRRQDWKLEPTFDRHLRNASIGNRYASQHEHLERFQYAVRGRRGPNPQTMADENDWWALAQHHGMMTPLLDWSVSPFVAAFFAYIEEGGSDGTQFRTIYGLSKPSVEEKVSEILREKEQEAKRNIGANSPLNKLAGLLASSPRPEVQFIKPLSEQNQRLISQNGLFTRAPTGVPLEEWISKNFPGEGDYILMKLLAPDSDREDCLRTLNRMNINYLTLFPDIDGASKYCNLAALIANY